MFVNYFTEYSINIHSERKNVNWTVCAEIKENTEWNVPRCDLPSQLPTSHAWYLIPWCWLALENDETRSYLTAWYVFALDEFSHDSESGNNAHVHVPSKCMLDCGTKVHTQEMNKVLQAYIDGIYM